MTAELECIEDWGEGTCRGPVEYRWSGGTYGKSWPRCAKHGAERVDRWENSIERYADSDVVPDWFDPMAAGETWDERG